MTTITLAGKQYQARGMDPKKDFAEVEQHLQSQRKDPIEAILPALEKLKDNPLATKSLLEIAYADLRRQKERLPAADVAAWLNGVDGFSFILWLLLRDGNPDLKELETVKDLVMKTVAQEGERKAMARLRAEQKAAMPPSGGPESPAQPAPPEA